MLILISNTLIKNKKNKKYLANKEQSVYKIKKYIDIKI